MPDMYSGSERKQAFPQAGHVIMMSVFPGTKEKILLKEIRNEMSHLQLSIRTLATISTKALSVSRCRRSFWAASLIAVIARAMNFAKNY